MGKLHNNSGIFSKIVKIIPKKEINLLDCIINNTNLNNKHKNQLKLLKNFSFMNCTELNEIFNNYGRYWFRLIPPSNISQNIVKLIDLKYEINKNIDNYSENEDNKLKILLNEENDILNKIFEKKMIFTSKMHLETRHTLEDIKNIGPSSETNCQKNEHFFTNFKKWVNGTKNSTINEITKGLAIEDFFFNIQEYITNLKNEKFNYLLSTLSWKIEENLFFKKKNLLNFGDYFFPKTIIFKQYESLDILALTNIFKENIPSVKNLEIFQIQY